MEITVQIAGGMKDLPTVPLESSGKMLLGDPGFGGRFEADSNREKQIRFPRAPGHFAGQQTLQTNIHAVQLVISPEDGDPLKEKHVRCSWQ